MVFSLGWNFSWHFDKHSLLENSCKYLNETQCNVPWVLRGKGVAFFFLFEPFNANFSWLESYKLHKAWMWPESNYPRDACLHVSLIFLLALKGRALSLKGCFQLLSVWCAIVTGGIVCVHGGSLEFLNLNIKTFWEGDICKLRLTFICLLQNKMSSYFLIPSCKVVFCVPCLGKESYTHQGMLSRSFLFG